MLKKYSKPEIDVINVRQNYLMVGSGNVEINQCHCEQHELYGGCNGCEGNCPCGGC